MQILLTLALGRRCASTTPGSSKAWGQWTWALFVLLHLDDAEQRAAMVMKTLGRHGGSIGDGDDDATFRLLARDFLIPEAWVWEAKALHARSVRQDHVAEVEFLLRARNWEEAHRTLCRTVAPQAIISGELDELRRLLGGFTNTELVPGWSVGGQVYADYLVLQAQDKDGDVSAGEPRAGEHREEVVKRLLAALPAMVREGSQAGFHERVAVQEMSGVLGKMMLRGEGIRVSAEQEGVGDASADARQAAEKSKMLSLPLTEDRYLKHTVELALGYYKAVMAGAKH